MKRILLILSLALVLTLALIGSSPAASAASADNYVEITWNGQKYGVDATGCTTWRDYLNTSDAHFRGHSIDAYGYVIYYIDLLDLSLRICDTEGNNVKADDPIKDIPYTFNCALFTFGNDVIVYDHNVMNTYFFDSVSNDIDPIPNEFWEEEDGSISYIGPNYERFEVYDPSGNRAQSGDYVYPVHYTLKLSYAFGVQLYVDGSPSGDVFSFHASVFDWSLGSLAHNKVQFTNTDLGTCFISKYVDYYAFCVDQNADGVYDNAYFLMTTDGMLVRYENSDLQALDYYLVDPCDFNCHIFGDWLVVTPPTCTESGVEGRYCGSCRLYESNDLKPLGHDRNWLGSCYRCGDNSVLGFFGNIGSSVADGAADLIEKGKDALDKGKDAVGEKASSFVTTIAIVAGLSIGIPIAILIGRFVKWLKKKK